MKKILMMLSLLFTGSAFAVVGIPVADNPSMVKRVIEWGEQKAKWAEEKTEFVRTVKHYKDQINAYKEQLATSTGVREIGEFMKEAKALQQEASSLYGDAKDARDALTGIYSLTTGEYAALAGKYGLMDSCKGLSLSMLESCQGSIASKLDLISRAENVSDSFTRKINSIQRLADRAESSKDTKESQDLANAVNLKAIELNALQLQWSMATEQAKAANVVWEEKREAAFQKQQLNAPVPTFN